jgi:ABC-2 type transport system permease protein
MKRVIDLFDIEIRQSLILFKRYPLNFIGGLFVLSLFFLGMFFGAAFLAGGIDFFQDGRVESAVISFIAWTLTITCFSSISSSITSDATQGTLEHIVSTGRSFLTVTLVRLIVTLMVLIVLNSIPFTIIALVTRSRFVFRWEIVFPIFTILLAASGLGLILGGVTLIAKQTNEFINLFQFLLLPAFFVSYGEAPQYVKYLVSALPCLSGMEFAREIMISQNSIMTSFWLIPAVSSGMAWFLLGIMIFQRCLLITKHRGLLNDY